MTYPQHALLGQVMAGDIVVLGSDGLWDNLSDEQILEQASMCHACLPSYALTGSCISDFRFSSASDGHLK